jgi:small conductance mechanosensitive channel
MQFNLENLQALIVQYGTQIIGALLVLVIGWWIIGGIARSVNKVLTARNIDATLRPFLVSMLEAAMKAMLVISAAGILGIQTTSFVAILGAAGLAVGLALQGSLANFAGGVLILIFKPFKLGDYIISQGFEGFVDELQIFTTTLRTHDGKKIILPNGPLSNNAMTNVTARGSLRVTTPAAIANIADLDTARQAMMSAALSDPRVLRDPAPVVLVSGLRDNGCDLIINTWCNAADAIDVGFAMTEGVKKAINNKGIAGPIQERHIISK